MKAVLLSIQPQWCEKIASGEKTVEVRKNRPQIETPFKCYIYMTATKERCRFWEYITAYQNSKGDILDGSQKVIGEFVCNKVEEIKAANAIQAYYNNREETCLTDSELRLYLGESTGYGWHISELKIYDRPKELEEFMSCNGEPIKRPFQSWGYVCLSK